MFKEEHSPQRHHHQHGYDRYQKKQINADPEYPEPRLETILKGLEDRVKAGRNNLFKLQYQRSELEFELRGLQDEKTILDGSLAEAKHGEALIREKERQINAEFMELSNDRLKSYPAPLIKRTLILGRELFSLLLRDVAIEDTARKAYEARVTRIQEETAKKVAERNKLQERVIMLQTDCEVDLEQKRHIYDEIHVLKKRAESLDAQISMLIEWRKSLENQITSIRAAIKQRQNTVSDPIVSSHSSSSKDNPENESEKFTQKVLPQLDDDIAQSLPNHTDETPPSSEASMLTVRTSRSVLFSFSSSTNSESENDAEEEDDQDGNDDEETESTSNEAGAAGVVSPFENILSQLRDVQNMSIPSETSSTTSKKPFGFKVWQEVLPSDISNSDASKKKSQKEDGEEEEQNEDENL